LIMVNALMMITTLLLLLAAPSLASSFVAVSSPTMKQADIGTTVGLHRRQTFTHKSHYHVILGISPGGSSEPQSNPPPPSDESNAADSSSAGALPPPPDVDTTPVAPVATAAASAAAATSLMGPNASEPGILRKKFQNMPWHRLPNILTYIRCLAIPLLVGLFYMPDAKSSNIATGVIFGIASATDWLDGYLARRWDISSPFGAFLDPVADKLMVSTSLILLSGRFGKVVAIPSLIILAREIAVSALREWMAQRGERDVVKVGMQGKVKTALTMTALTMLLFVPSPTAPAQKFFSALYQPSIVLLYLCSLVTVTSGSVYFRAAGPALLQK
jgi:CDP-diacylglycerol--glycerol-3-phosphate 3-phosphatidyltransferase